MNILLTNDDGILAEGITAMCEALSSIAGIYIFAPKDQKSASGHGITIGKSMTMEEMNLPPAVRAFAVNGTPADCVRLGLYFMEKAGVTIDKVVSGANHGLNLGTDTLYSGTVSAAVEGAMNGKPSIAISVGSVTPTDFTVASRIAVMAANLPADIHKASVALSFNIPHRSYEEIKGIRVTKLGVMEYEEIYTEKEIAENLLEFVYAGKPVFKNSLLPGTDIERYCAGFITVTPLHYDLTDHQNLDRLHEYFHNV
jgi:5'-nucleotidase